MFLPNAHQAVIEEAKVLSYLLDLEHPIGGAKARFFTQFGFCREQWSVLREALLRHALDNEIRIVTQTGFGPRYEIWGAITCPDGRRPNIVTVWQQDNGCIAPRLITAYPVSI